MNERVVSFNTPETKQWSIQCLKGKLGPIKCKLHQTKARQLISAFFDNKGLIYTDFMSKATLVNATYILESRGKLLKIFRK